MRHSRSKPLMRSLGEFVGHIIKGVKTDPSTKVVKRTVEEERKGNLTLRRTTIEEIELNNDSGRRT